MADTLPINFPVPSESAVASYNYTDIAEGTGIVTFQGFNSVDDSGISYKLSSNAPYSNDIYTQETIDAQTYTKEIDADFDVEFNGPHRIRGKVICNVPIGLGIPSGTGYAYVIAKLRKWDGSTETEIASEQSETLDNITTDTAKMLCFVIDASSAETKFNKGDTLRITLEVWTKRGGTSGPKVAIGHSPQQRDASASDCFTTGDLTKLTFYVPFVLDL